jgi:hypothetical protein
MDEKEQAARRGSQHLPDSKGVRRTGCDSELYRGKQLPSLAKRERENITKQFFRPRQKNLAHLVR